MAGCKNLLNQKKKLNKILVPRLYHFEIMICIRKFNLVNILDQVAYLEI